MNKTKIEWAEATWNPIQGCNVISPGCANCYAKRIMHRFKKPWIVTLKHNKLYEPLMWKSPRRIFVCSMSDIFNPLVSDKFRQDIFTVMRMAHWHKFYILTKRPELIPQEYSQMIASNVLMGITIESNDYLGRQKAIERILHHRNYFISFEPLLSEIDIEELHLNKLAWVIVGGETGPKARPMLPEWARILRMACRLYQIPFFFKSWGSHKMHKGQDKNRLDGKIWNELPIAFQNFNGGK